MKVVAVAVICSMLAACGDPPDTKFVKDVEIVRNFDSRRDAFNGVVDMMYQKPYIKRIELGQSLVIEPKSISAERAQRLAGELEKTGLKEAEAYHDGLGKRVVFVVSLAGVSIAGALKKVVYSEIPVEGPFVGDTDEFMKSQPRDRFVYATRELDENWYITFSRN